MMEHTMNDDSMTILCEGPLTSTTATGFQQEVQALMEAYKPQRVTFDLKQVHYISSAGLRVFMVLLKSGTPMEMINVNREVYETLDITGFVSLFPIARRMRKISVANAELIGSGFFSKVYKITDDSIVKVFIRDTSLEDIKREQELAKQAFVLGIPAAITFDIAEVDGKYGLLFEAINGGTFTQRILSDPEHLDTYIEQYAALLKTINTTRVDADSIPPASRIAEKKLETIREYMTEAEHAKLQGMLAGIPDTHTYVHADCHTGNIMLQNDEMLIIDLDTLCSGNPIFEMASLFITYTVFEECDPGNCLAFLKMDRETCSRLFYDTVRCYFQGLDSHELEENIRKIRVCGYFQMLYWNKVNKPEDHHMFEVCYRRLKECMEGVRDLVLRLPFGNDVC